MNIYQWYMLLFLLIYFGVIIGLRSILLYQHTRVNATKNFGKEKEKRIAERIIQIALLIMLMVGLNFIFIEPNYKYFIPIEFLELKWISLTGFVISILGMLLTFIAQLQMKDSWRLGIDEEKEVKLITQGLFSISRNPIYLGLGISFIGFFMIAPNIGSIVFLILMYYGLNKKIEDEQRFLVEKFGMEYEEYKLKVNKWI